MTSRAKKIASFNARIAATLRRLAQEAPKKQDPNKTMMGGWSEEEKQQAKKMVGKFKELASALSNTTAPLAEYTNKFSPDSIKQVGHIVSFVSTVKPVVDRLSKVVTELQSALKSFS